VDLNPTVERDYPPLTPFEVLREDVLRARGVRRSGEENNELQMLWLRQWLWGVLARQAVRVS
jgi:hypothetical protein